MRNEAFVWMVSKCTVLPHTYQESCDNKRTEKSAEQTKSAEQARRFWHNKVIRKFGWHKWDYLILPVNVYQTADASNFSLSRESLFVASSVLLRVRCCPESFSSCLCCSTSPKNRFKVILKLYFHMSDFDLSVEYRRILVHLEMTGALKQEIQTLIKAVMRRVQRANNQSTSRW